MGIHNIWRLLDYFAEPTNGEQWRGRTIAVDASVWLSQMAATSSRRRSGAKSAEERLLAAEGIGGLGGGGVGGWGQLSGEEMSSVLEGFLERIIRLLSLDITPVFVFDGKAPEAKLQEQARRRKQRAHTEDIKLVSAAGIVVDAQLASLEGGSSGGEDLHSRVQRLVKERHKDVNMQHQKEQAQQQPNNAHNHDLERLKKLAIAALKQQQVRNRKPVTPSTAQMGDSSDANVSRFLSEEGYRVEAMQRSRNLLSTNRLQASISSTSSLFLGTSDALAAAVTSTTTTTASSTLTPAEALDDVDDDIVEIKGKVVPKIQPRHVLLNTVSSSSPSSLLRGVTTQLVPALGTRRPREEHSIDESSSQNGDDDGVIDLDTQSINSCDGVEEEDEVELSGSSSSSSLVCVEDQNDERAEMPHYQHHHTSNNGAYVVDDTVSISDDGGELSITTIQSSQQPCGSQQHQEEDAWDSSTASSYSSLLMGKLTEAVRRQDARHNTSSASLLSHTTPIPDQHSGSSSGGISLQESSYGLHRVRQGSNTGVVEEEPTVEDESQIPDTSALAHTLQDVLTMLRLCGVPYVISPAEADAQCAYLCDAGLVDAVFTEDSDVVAHGADVVLRGFFSGETKRGNQSGKAATPPPPVRAYRRAKMTAAGLPPFHLKLLAVLLGCDYTGGLQGIGLSRALRLLSAFTLYSSTLPPPTNTITNAPSNSQMAITGTHSSSAARTLDAVSTTMMRDASLTTTTMATHKPPPSDGPWSILQTLLLQPAASIEVHRYHASRVGEGGGAHGDIRGGDNTNTTTMLLRPEVLAALFHPPFAPLKGSLHPCNCWKFSRGEINWDGIRHFATIREVSSFTLDRLIHLRQLLQGNTSNTTNQLQGTPHYSYYPPQHNPPPTPSSSTNASSAIPDACHVKSELIVLSAIVDV